MTTADIRLTADQENALRESQDTGYWYPMTADDHRIAEYLTRHGLFARLAGRSPSPYGGYRLTAAGRDWLATHPTEVAR